MLMVNVKGFFVWMFIAAMLPAPVRSEWCRPNHGVRREWRYCGQADGRLVTGTTWAPLVGQSEKSAVMIGQ